MVVKSHYKYDGLDPQDIRILQITRGPESDEITYSLRHMPLNDDFTYTALSYTWGNQNGTPIIVDGCHFPVGKNLSAALYRFCKGADQKTEGVRVWIDAICINQQDEVEKGTQVRRMKEIYEKSKQVVIWLGEEAEDSAYAMSAIDRIDRRWASRSSQSADQRHIPMPNFDHRSAKAIHNLFRRSWWSRVWVIQEATCTNNTYVWCGNDKTDFIAVVAVANFLTQRIYQQALQQDFASSDVRHLYRVIALDELKARRSQSGDGSNLLELLDSSRTCGATDPRDKIFALLALAIPLHRDAIHPNYSISSDEVYARFTKNFIEAEGALNILGHCQAALPDPQSWSSFETLTASQMSGQAAPSWVPNWTIMLETTPFIKHEVPNDASSRKMYHASGNFLPSVQHTDDLGTLVLRGFAFDTISSLGRNFADPFNTSTIRAWHLWIGEVLGSTYHTGETTQEAILRTLVADIQIREGRYVRGFAASWPISNDLDDGNMSGYYIRMALNGRGMFLSSEGRMGLARFDVMEGDKICILHGGHVPFVLRQEGSQYLFKGECYVHGLMDGEAMRYPKVWQQFSLR